jgi:ferredoxin-NADP reductase
MTSTSVRFPGADAPESPLAARATWKLDLEHTLVCVGVEQETHDVRSFTFRTEQLPRFRFDPGQYLTVTVEVGGQLVSRCYTIASSPTRADSLTITVKRVPHGPVSNWLHDHLEPGSLISATGPFGRFTTTEARATDKYLFLSAGSGITPLMSMTRTAVDLASNADIVFVHSARTPEDIIFRSELDRLHASRQGLRVVIVCEDGSKGAEWVGPRGRLSSDLLHEAVPDLGEREVFTCGPAPYMEGVRRLLEGAGLDPSRCHEESFDFTTVSSDANAAGASAPRHDLVESMTHSVEFRRSGRTVVTDSATTILEAAASAGLILPSSCREGVCGTCKSTLVSGNVLMDHQGGLRRREIDQNKILLCCSTPTTDLVVDA